MTEGKAKGRHFVPVEEAPGDGLSDRSREVLAILLVGACLYALVSLATLHQPLPGTDGAIPRDGWRNLGGKVGFYLAYGFTWVLGLAGWLPFIFGLIYGVAWFTGREIERLVIKCLGAVVFTAVVSIALAGSSGTVAAGELAPYAGGRFGANISPRLYGAFGGTGRILLLVFGGLTSLLLATEWLFSHVLERSARFVEAGVRRLREPRMATADGPAFEDALEEGMEEEEEEEVGGEPEPARKKQKKGKKEKKPRKSRRKAKAEADEEEVEAVALDEEEVVEEEPEEEIEEEIVEEEPEEEVEEEVLESEPRAAEPDEFEIEDPEAPAPQPKPKKKRKSRAKKKKPKVIRHRMQPGAQQSLPFDATYPFPPIELFREPEGVDTRAADSVLQRNSDAIVERLSSFKVEAEVVGVSLGPAVTQYEIRLGHGVRVGRISAFEADLAAALRSVSVRVVAPIPGRDTVGIEVPNEERQTVFLRELLEQFGRADDQAIPLFLGKDVSGRPIVEDLARMPHLLIAGTTGSGKSVCINTILLSILMTRTPHQVRLVLIDPKMVELQAYKAAPHLCCDVVTNMKKAPSVLEWAVEEMEQRYTMLSAVGTNHIKSYNKLGKEELEKRLQHPIEPDRVELSYIVLVIDELADLMNTAAKEVEESIQRLAQKSRAVGMHVILATQRPSTEVITGIIKANLPCQIAFKVNRKIDSRVILDSNGAEKLLGHGDMLYVPPGGGRMTRAQGTFVSEEELHSVMEFLKDSGQCPNFMPDLVQTQSAKKGGMEQKDDLYGRAVEVILTQQRGSASLLQRALAVGYTRATRLLELMEEDGVVGPFVGSKAREVMMTLEDWHEREASIAAELDRLEEEELEEDEGDEYEVGVEGDAGDEGEEPPFDAD